MKPAQKDHSRLSHQPPLKIKVLSSLPLFQNLVGGSPHPAEKGSAHYEIGIEINEKSPKFKLCDYVGISKYKTIFARVYTPNWSEEDFVIKKVENTMLCTYAIGDLNSEELKKDKSNRV